MTEGIGILVLKPGGRIQCINPRLKSIDLECNLVDTCSLRSIQLMDYILNS
jgi:hypothetical protein